MSCQPYYRSLLRHLHDIDFTYMIPMDGNRAEDGINLRYRFGEENGYDDHEIAAELDIFPCSVLEMMVALAIRCEESIMYDSEYGDRTALWFWSMIKNLGLGRISGYPINKAYVDDVISRFLNRDYRPDGKGGLFAVKNCTDDMRTIEIWYQMCRYLDCIAEEGG